VGELEQRAAPADEGLCLASFFWVFFLEGVSAKRALRFGAGGGRGDADSDADADGRRSIDRSRQPQQLTCALLLSDS